MVKPVFAGCPGHLTDPAETLVAAHTVRHGTLFPAVKICDAVDKDYAPSGIIPLPDPEAPLRVSGSCSVEGFSQYTIEIREREVVLSLVGKFSFPSTRSPFRCINYPRFVCFEPSPGSP